MKKILKFIPLFLLISLPLMTYAQTFAGLSERIYQYFVPMLVNFFLTFAILFFAWGVLQVIITEGDRKAVAKERLLWATVALFVMVSFWGILKIVNETFFINDLGEGSYSSSNINDFKVKDGMTGKIGY